MEQLVYTLGLVFVVVPLVFTVLFGLWCGIVSLFMPSEQKIVHPERVITVPTSKSMTDTEIAASRRRIQ